MKATIYDKTNGQIQMVVHSPDINGIEAQRVLNPNYEIYYDSELSLADYYFENDQPKERPVMPLSFSSTRLKAGQTLEVSNIPAGTTVIHPAGIDIVDDGFIEWSTDFPGSYQFTFICFPYKEIVINAEVE